MQKFVFLAELSLFSHLVSPFSQLCPAVRRNYSYQASAYNNYSLPSLPLKTPQQKKFIFFSWSTPRFEPDASRSTAHHLAISATVTHTLSFSKPRFLRANPAHPVKHPARGSNPRPRTQKASHPPLGHTAHQKIDDLLILPVPTRSRARLYSTSLFVYAISSIRTRSPITSRSRSSIS